MAKGGVKVIARNKKAHHDYHIEDTFEAGIVLTGTEIKSIRQGRVNLRDSFARIDNGEVFLLNMHISPFEQGNRFNPDPTRTRKLLLHREEIRKLIGLTRQKGYTLIPLSMYWKNNRAKLDLGLARGKQEHDKRDTEKERDWNREKQRVMRAKNKPA